MRMKRGLAIALFGALACVGVSSIAQAGGHGVATVSAVVYADGSVYGSGAVMSARDSADSVQYIYCWSEAYSTSTAGYGFCSARNAAGTIASCSTTNPLLVERMLAVGTHSLVSFQSNTSGECTWLRVRQSSLYGP